MINKFHLEDKFFVSNRNFTTYNVKIFLNSRYFSDFYSKFQVFQGFYKNLISLRFSFCLSCQISGFSRFPSKVATLNNTSKLSLKIVQKNYLHQIIFF